MDRLLGLGGLAILAVLAVVLVLVARVVLPRWRGRRTARILDDRAGAELAARADRVLAEALGAGVGTHLEEPPALETLAAVDETPDGDPVYVPVVRVPLGTVDAPKMDLAFEYVADVLDAVHPVFADEPVRGYDVRFAFGPGGLLVGSECRRIVVPPAMADRLRAEPTYRAHDLRRDVERATDADGEPIEGDLPVLWGGCRES